MFEIILESSYNFLSAEYLELFAGSRATAFQHPLWLDRLYGKLAPRLNAEPLVIAARWRHSGRLAMLLPLLRRRHGAVRVIEFADLQVSDYAAPVCDDITFAQIASDREARERICAHLKPYDLLRIQKIGQNAPPLEQLFGVDRRTFMGMSAHAVRSVRSLPAVAGGEHRPLVSQGIGQEAAATEPQGRGPLRVLA